MAVDDVKLQYVKFYEYILVNKDLSILYGTAKNMFFYMYVSDLNYIIPLSSPVLKEELETMLKSHTQIFMQHYQSRMNLIKNEKELIALKKLLYSCKRAV